MNGGVTSCDHGRAEDRDKDICLPKLEMGSHSDNKRRVLSCRIYRLSLPACLPAPPQLTFLNQRLCSSASSVAHDTVLSFGFRGSGSGSGVGMRERAAVARWLAGVNTPPPPPPPPLPPKLPRPPGGGEADGATGESIAATRAALIDVVVAEEPDAPPPPAAAPPAAPEVSRRLPSRPADATPAPKLPASVPNRARGATRTRPPPLPGAPVAEPLPPPPPGEGSCPGEGSPLAAEGEAGSTPGAVLFWVPKPITCSLWT